MNILLLSVNSSTCEHRVREVPLKYGVKQTTSLPKNGVPISFFSESSVCLRVMKHLVPCTLWLWWDHQLKRQIKHFPVRSE